MSTKKRLKTMVLRTLVLGIGLAGFWAVWFFAGYAALKTNAIEMTSWWTMNLPFCISRWWDIPVSATWVILIIIALHGKEAFSFRKKSGLLISLIFGVLYGLAFGLNAGLIPGLLTGSIIALILAFGLTLFAGFRCGLMNAVGFGLGLGLIYSLAYSAIIGLFINIIIALLFLVFYGLVLITKRFVVLVFKRLIQKQ